MAETAYTRYLAEQSQAACVLFCAVLQLFHSARGTALGVTDLVLIVAFSRFVVVLGSLLVIAGGSFVQCPVKIGSPVGLVRAITHGFRNITQRVF
jgi:hypothetical protein